MEMTQTQAAQITTEFATADLDSMDRAVALLDARWLGERAARQGMANACPRSFDAAPALAAAWRAGVIAVGAVAGA